MFYYKILPIINLFIGSSALAFQIIVLYPWHEQLDRDFKELREEYNQKLKIYHELKVKRFDELENKLKSNK